MILQIGLIAFAVAFVIVGFLRVVEFKAAGLGPKQRMLLIPVHVIGCIAFAGAMYLMATDAHNLHRELTARLFFGSVLVLFPIHIFVALKRRILMSAKHPHSQS